MGPHGLGRQRPPRRRTRRREGRVYFRRIPGKSASIPRKLCSRTCSLRTRAKRFVKHSLTTMRNTDFEISHRARRSPSHLLDQVSTVSALMIGWRRSLSSCINYMRECPGRISFLSERIEWVGPCCLMELTGSCGDTPESVRLLVMYRPCPDLQTGHPEPITCKEDATKLKGFGENIAQRVGLLWPKIADGLSSRSS